MSLLHHGLALHHPVLVDEVLPLTRLLVQLGPVGTHPELPLEQLDPDDGEHEEEQHRDQHDVADGLHSHYDTLYHMFQTLGTVYSSRMWREVRII